MLNPITRDNITPIFPFDKIPINNMQRNDLASAMVRGKGAEEFHDIITEDTLFYKLSWREKYPIETSAGDTSIYSYYLNLEITNYNLNKSSMERFLYFSFFSSTFSFSTNFSSSKLAISTSLFGSA
mgnify:CR=1 FL=1